MPTNNTPVPQFVQTAVIAGTDLNRIHHNNFIYNALPDKCANLIIADPPYYKVKGDFDFIWKTFEDYLIDVEKWAVECKRLLADNGTILWYGDAKNIAYSQIIFDKYFNLLNNVVWENTNDHKQQIRFNPELRSFAPLTERVLMYSNETYNLTQCVFLIRDYIRGEIIKSKGKIILKHVNEALGTATNGGGVASAALSLDKAEPTMLTKEMYVKLQIWCFPNLRKEYEDLRKEYEDLRRPFNNALHLGDVIRLPNYETGDYDHDTVKPEKLTRILIKACSRENDLIIVPFAGSGTECAMAIKENRNFVGYEITKKHVDMSNKRVKKLLDNPPLFNVS
jgi:site-specific DNA-methyltransferase (adenine-specific)